MILKSKTLCAAAIIVTVAVLTAVAGDWPNWHGPDWNNKSKETGLLKEWPKDGPKLLWTAKGMGEGYSSVSVAGGVIYTAGAKNKANYVFAFDQSGKLLWEKAAGGVWDAKRAHARQYSGSRATPTVNQGVVYYLSDLGRLLALDAKTGAEKWSLNLAEKYKAEEMPMYGFSESPLIVGNRLYVSVYGDKTTAVCLDKNTGSVIWESERVAGGTGDSYAGYASFVYAENSGFKQLIAFTSGNLYGMNADNGKVLWTVPFNNSRNNNCTDVIYHDGQVFASSGYGRGSILVKLSAKDGGVHAEKVYDIKLMDNHHGGLILHDGRVYGAGHNAKGWFCIDFKTGRQLWNAPGKGSMTFAEGMLYMYDEGGMMTLARAAADKLTPAGSFRVPEGGKGAYWARPVVSNGVLYVRHADNMYAYDVKGK